MLGHNRDEDPTFYITEKNENPLGVYDVICGRHKAAFDNIGNRRFRVLVALAQDKYTSAPTRAHKTTVIRSIIDSVHNGGGRFLQRLGCNWVELDAKQTHDKVGHALRDMAITGRIKTKSPTQTGQTLSTHGKNEPPRREGFTVAERPQSDGWMSLSDDNTAFFNTTVDGYTVFYSGNGAITEGRHNVKELYVDDPVSCADGSTQRTRPFDYDRRIPDIPQNLFLHCIDQTFVV
jgi:hypothetical protein